MGFIHGMQVSLNYWGEQTSVVLNRIDMTCDQIEAYRHNIINSLQPCEVVSQDNAGEEHVKPLTKRVPLVTSQRQIRFQYKYSFAGYQSKKDPFSI